MRDLGATHQLVQRAQAGDTEAYDQLFGHVAERLLVYIRVRLGKELRSKLDPVDVLQEVYVEVHRSFASFVPDDWTSFSRWSYRIADNRLHDLALHHATKKRTPPGRLVRDSQVIARIRAENTGPSTAAGRQEESRQLVEALEALEPEEREAILLRFFQDMSLEEIAKALNRSKSTVKRLLGNGKVKLGFELQAGP